MGKEQLTHAEQCVVQRLLVGRIGRLLECRNGGVDVLHGSDQVLMIVF